MVRTADCNVLVMKRRFSGLVRGISSWNALQEHIKIVLRQRITMSNVPRDLHAGIHDSVTLLCIGSDRPATPTGEEGAIGIGVSGKVWSGRLCSFSSFKPTHLLTLNLGMTFLVEQKDDSWLLDRSTGATCHRQCHNVTLLALSV